MSYKIEDKILSFGVKESVVTMLDGFTIATVLCLGAHVMGARDSMTTINPYRRWSHVVTVIYKHIFIELYKVLLHHPTNLYGAKHQAFSRKHILRNQ